MSSPLLLRVAFGIGAVGFAASLAVHLLTFTEAKPPAGVGVLHLGVFLAFVPVVFAAKAWMEGRGVEAADPAGQQAALRTLLGGLPTWQKALLGALSAYAIVNFGLGFLRAQADPGAESGARLFSGHWMVFYAASTVLARRLLALRRRSPT